MADARALTAGILDALKALAFDHIWASELAFFGTERRIDFWTLQPARSAGFRATAYEIKVSREDFRRDSEEKQSGALRFSDRFFYVTPPGMLTKADLPTWAGLMEWDGKRFAMIRRPPKRRKVEPDWQFIVSLMRNCGDSRRDVGLMKAQIGYLESRVRDHERTTRANSEFRFRRFMAQQAAALARTEDGGPDALR